MRIHPMSAYELVKFSKESIGLFWNESYGHIHKSIKQLEQEGSVTIVEENETGRRKIVYGVTEQGRRQLDSWLAQTPEESVMRNELLMKIFVADEGHIPQLVIHIEQELEASRKYVQLLEGIRTSIPQDKGMQAKLWLLTLDYGERYLRMTIEWCEHALELLNRSDRRERNG
ncbi:PadR family transcriptional regulator [Cohnella sp. GCM10027633]|uniref:PadR family transcriptional regulator n=1 Tax=unclassified Cohnella TaxID=2636738 RepID=UPI003629A2D2